MPASADLVALRYVCLIDSLIHVYVLTEGLQITWDRCLRT